MYALLQIHGKESQFQHGRTIMEYCAYVIILLTVFFDALRDGFLHEGWLKRHIFKWLQLYTPIIYILIIFEVVWWLWIILAIAGWVLWHITIRKICHKNWESWIVRIIKNAKIFLDKLLSKMVN